MKSVTIIFMFIIVISNIFENMALKRIKRESGGNRNHTKIAEDFVVLQRKDKNNSTTSDETINSKTKEVITPLYNTKKQLIINNSLNHTENMSNESEYSQKRTQDNRFAYVVRDKKQHLKRNNKGSRRIPLSHAGSNVPSMTLEANLLDGRNGEQTTFRPVAPIFSNIDGPYVYHSMSPFTPLDQMMRFANMLYKVGVDDVSAKNAKSLSDTINSFDSSAQDPYLVEFPLASAQTSSKTGAKQFQMHSRVSNKSLTNDKPLDVIDLFEETLLSPGDKMEIFCPQHNHKGSSDEGNNQNSNDVDMDNGVIQVCTCHFSKKYFDDHTKELK